MFTTSVERHFQASHQLTLPDGSKEPVHRHDWVVTASISSEKLNNMGVVMDFQVVKAMIDKTLACFDNKALESVSYFQQNNPSVENVAKYIYEKLRIKLPEDVSKLALFLATQPDIGPTAQSFSLMRRNN